MGIAAQQKTTRTGYRQTDVGVMPEDWKLADFDALGSVIDGDRGANYPSSEDFSNSGYCLFLDAGNVTKEGFRFTDCAFITHEKDARLNKGKLKRNDTVLTTRGTVGNLAYFDASVPFENIRINSGMVILRNTSSSLDTSFLYCLLRSRLVQKQIERLSFGSAQPQLTVKGISKFGIVLPLLPEQRLIAEALRDVDSLIRRLDQLIAKNRDIRQAAMQQLLTGKRRLPGFGGKWEVKRLGTLLRFQVGFPFSSAFFNQKGNGIRLVKNRDLKSDDQIFCYSGEYSPAYLVADGDVLVGMDGDFIPCLWRKGPALLNQRVGKILPSSGMDRNFAYYVLIEPLKAIEIVTSSTTVKHLSHGNIEDIEQSIPAMDEQVAIATVLSDMDADIAALETRCNKTHAIKQGMMQQLLTGNIRLI
jgi:type I restriction enzyme S subunit